MPHHCLNLFPPQHPTGWAMCNVPYKVLKNQPCLLLPLSLLKLASVGDSLMIHSSCRRLPLPPQQKIKKIKIKKKRQFVCHDRVGPAAPAQLRSPPGAGDGWRGLRGSVLLGSSSAATLGVARSSPAIPDAFVPSEGLFPSLGSLPPSTLRAQVTAQSSICPSHSPAGRSLLVN
ncbi:uncharacterized protein C1orf21 homolog isoform X1 [Dromiciops gliroides]|uniref:uncharacterized protein C1orf21 homolog isoform X1 n=1 Tax=Dromiciops gliroides TaxID=33562 RepID=UPI001CC58BB4|nr:uncharacterized protein C1orf21 homolog isoform X1 [Dromiciops gliroides]